MKTEQVSIKGEADGPTSIFLARKFPIKQPLREHIRHFMYRCRRKRAEKTIRANPHKLKKVIAYADAKYHLTEVPKTEERYQEHYLGTKESLILKHRPELFGSMARIQRPDVRNKEAVMEMCRQLQRRSEFAAGIADSEMPMDLHVYEIHMGGGIIEIVADYRWDLLAISFTGNKKVMRKLQKITLELYLYYGVTEEDIKNRTERYRTLLISLCSR